MNLRATSIIVIVFLAVQFAGGCAMFDRPNEELPADRPVKTVEFPTRHLEYSEIDCRQKYEDVELSGTLKNISPYELARVGVEIKMFFSVEGSFEIAAIVADPPMLYPGETADFSYATEVEYPVSRVEVHAVFKQVR